MSAAEIVVAPGLSQSREDLLLTVDDLNVSFGGGSNATHLYFHMGLHQTAIISGRPGASARSSRTVGAKMSA